MEHIVQIAIGVDDDRIKNIIEEKAEEQIILQLTQEIRDVIFKKSSYYRKHADPARDPLSNFSEGLMMDVIEKHTDTIVEKAAELLADRLMRTKAVKEAIKRVTEEF